MSNYEDAIGRAQAMIDAAQSNALTAGGGSPYSMDRANTLAGLARVQLELASMWEPASEPQPEVKVESASLESLQRMLDDRSLKKMLVEQFETRAEPGKMRPFTLAGIVEDVLRGVLRSETPPVAERAASEGDFKCGLINDEGVMCSYPQHHRDWTNSASHSWNQEKPKSRDSDPVPWPKGYEPDYCGVLDDEGSDCVFPKGHPSSHSWTWGER